ncbi:hypothetical protein KIN20_018284 [Parelaphostrongylus tenuis]|uniref:Uncharacterized protein n=1 Tax=Parelaphostrongylus tenuis TaxID=148309 RepID=A0AAD5N1S8_PARTN|nr:hypothetical protein KIN20_018284 [Parelaphostrongylus tenuis]
MAEISLSEYMKLQVHSRPSSFCCWGNHQYNHETLMEIAHVSKLLASTQASITHAEIPFPLLATIAHLYSINFDEFQRLWINEKDTRCRKVLEVYKKDYLTINFIEKIGIIAKRLWLSESVQVALVNTRIRRSATARHPNEIGLPESDISVDA